VQRVEERVSKGWKCECAKGGRASVQSVEERACKGSASVQRDGMREGSASE
jgi:hypothetical protein